MHLTLRQLLIFAAVAEAGSTTAASGRVALSQSATSAALNELEKVLGARLFDRVGKRLIINDNGRTLLPQARAALDVASGIESDFSVGARAPRSTHPPINLRIAASTTIGNYLLPGLITPFRRQFPQARFEVRITNTRHASEAVGRFEVDMGLIEGPSYEADGREWRTPPLWGLRLIAIVNGHDRLLHDGRARGVAEAILWHGGEAEAARDAFRRLPAADRAALVTFVESL